MSEIKFVKSAVSKSDYPQGRRPEVAIVGRSNSGKSSLINSLAGSKIARVSQSPGKTQLLHFFLVKDSYFLVDSPGYGFAARSADQRMGWSEMIEGYLRNRKNLVGLLLLMDIRRPWSEDEELLLRWWSERERPMAVILTKADKLGKNDVVKKVKEIQEFIGSEAVFPVSSLRGQGIVSLKQFIFEKWVKCHPGLC